MAASRATRALANGAAKTSSKSAAADQQGFDMLELVQRRWTIVLGSVVACWALAAAYYLVAPAWYESQSQLLVMSKDSRLPTQGVAGAPTTDTTVSEDLLATQMQVVQSRRIVSQALAANGFDKLPSILDQLDEGDKPEDYVIDNLDVTRGGEGQAADAHVLNIGFKHSSPSESKQILEAIIKQYQQFTSEKFQDVNKEAADLISQARTDLSKELADAEAAYRTYREEAPVLWSGDESTNVHRTRFDQLQAELSELSIQINQAQARLVVVKKTVEEQDEHGANDLERLVVIDEANATRVSMLVAVQQGEADTAEFQSLQPERMENAKSQYEALLALLMKEKQLLMDFGPQHPEVEYTRQQIATAQEFLKEKTPLLGISGNEKILSPADLQKAYVNLLDRDLQTLLERKKELEAEAAVEEKEAKSLAKYELEGESLRLRVARQQALYDTVVDRLREINLAGQYGGIINEVIAFPEEGEDVWPNLPICLALGTILGLAIGTGSASVVELRDRSFQTADDVKEALDLPLLSTVPAMDFAANTALQQAAASSGSGLDSTLVAFHLPRSRESEVFRGLRTSLLFRSDEANIKTIAFTSPEQSDGKTTVVANLAVSIAQSGRSVLLVGADLRRPKISGLFGLHGDGLTKIIGENADPADVIHVSSVPNLSVLPCGAVAPNPAELLSSGRFREFLAVVREKFDFVLIDCPPVLAVSDPCIVSNLVDAVVMVVKVSADARPRAMHAKEMLDDVGANVIGAVVNGAETRRTGGYGGYGYRYGYGYGYGSDYEQEPVQNGEAKKLARLDA